MANTHFQFLRPDIIMALPYPLSLLCELKYFSLTQTSLSANWWLEEPTHTSNKPWNFASPKLLPMDNEEEKNNWTNSIIYTGWRAFVSENRLAFQTSPHLALFVAVKQFWWHNVKSTKQSIPGPTTGHPALYLDLDCLWTHPPCPPPLGVTPTEGKFKFNPKSAWVTFEN